MTRTGPADDPGPSGGPELPADIARAIDAFVVHLERERGRSRHTVRAYRSDLTDLLQGPARLTDLDLAHLRTRLAETRTAGASRSTLARRAAAVRTFTAWAVRTGLLKTDPAARLGSPRAGTVLPEVMDAAQAGVVLAAAGSGAAEDDPEALRDLAVLELLYATGVRVAELCGLDVDDVDEGRRTLRVLGKGGRERTVVFGVPAERVAATLAGPRAPGAGRRGVPARAAARRARRAPGPAGRAHRRAPRREFGSRRPGHRAARSPACCGHPPSGRRRGPPLRTGVTRSRYAVNDTALHACDRRPAEGGS